MVWRRCDLGFRFPGKFSLVFFFFCVVDFFGLGRACGFAEVGFDVSLWTLTD